MYTQSSLVTEFKDKDYRDAFVGSQIRMLLPLQIRGMRESSEMTQAQLAEAAHMAQPRISELETPGERRLTIETLLRIASAFDVALQVRFVPFSELADWSDSLDIDHFSVMPFLEELKALEAVEQTSKRTRVHRRVRRRRLYRRSDNKNVLILAIQQQAPAPNVEEDDQFSLFENAPIRKAAEVREMRGLQRKSDPINELNAVAAMGGGFNA